MTSWKQIQVTLTASSSLLALRGQLTREVLRRIECSDALGLLIIAGEVERQFRLYSEMGQTRQRGASATVAGLHSDTPFSAVYEATREMLAYYDDCHEDLVELQRGEIVALMCGALAFFLSLTEEERLARHNSDAFPGTHYANVRYSANFE